MEIWQSFAKLLIIAGIFLVALGVLVLFAGKIPGLGRLPGDIYFHRGNFTFYFPLATSVILSILLTIIINLLLRR